MLLFKKQNGLFFLMGAVLVLGLSACGFRPMHASTETGQTVKQHYNTIEVANIPDRSGQFLRNALIDRLYTQGRPFDPVYSLRIARMDENTVSLGVRKDATATRGQMEITIKMRLFNTRSGQVVLERDIHAMGGYNILDSEYATLVSENKTRELILDELSDRVMNEVNLFLLRTYQ